MDVWNWIQGSVEVTLTSADPGGMLTKANEHGIPVYNADMGEDGLTCRFSVPRPQYRRLKALAQRRGDDLKITARQGLYWRVKALLGRPVLLSGLLLLILLTVLLPTRVFFFRVEGNETISDRMILEIARECGIEFGVSRRVLRSEKMKNALLEAIPQLQWAGINTSGCVATISVRERQIPEKTESKGGVSSIVASRDGVVWEYTVVRGNGLCRAGQAVKAGQVLISGYTDCGLSIRATRAEGEVYAKTERDLTVVTPTNRSKRGGEVTTEKKYALIIGKKRINFYQGSGILDTTCGKMYTKSYVTLPGGFALPIALVIEEWTYWEDSVAVLAEEDASLLLSSFARDYLAQQMVAGQILSSQEAVLAEDGILALRGKYACLEMIGQVRIEEIIE